jgi:23S rRNA (uracil1939-C5)-methyltransferase
VERLVSGSVRLGPNGRRKPPTVDAMSSVVRLRTHAVAVGGDAIGRTEDGKVVFVDGGLPDEELEVTLDDDRKDFAKGHVTAVFEASPSRVNPTCPHVADGCGGCGWQHVATAAQPALKVAMVVDSLRRIGRIGDAEKLVITAPPLKVRGHRNSVRAGIVDGVAGFRAAGSSRIVPVNSCEVTHPIVERILTAGKFGKAKEVSIRYGTVSNQVLVLVEPTARGVVLPEVDADVVVIGLDELERFNKARTKTGDDAPESEAFFEETVAGANFSISADSFFQTRTDGAEMLVDLVTSALGEERDLLLDLYGGVGLFAATVGSRFSTVVSVESNESASNDAILNLASHPDGYLVCEDVDKWRPAPEMFESRRVAVVADPSRKGLGRQAVGTISRTGAVVVVLVSCDAGSLGRDARLLIEAGYDLTGSVVVDLFPQTPHVEVVSRFVLRLLP